MRITARVVRLALYAGVFLLAATGCTDNRPSSKPAASISVTDFRDATVTLMAPATRAVCLIESALSGIYMLGVQERVVGISSNVYSGDVARQYAALDDRIRLKKMPAPGNWDFVSIEGVLALKPDIVIIWASQTESIATLERHGIPVYGVMLKSLADIYKEMRDFGMLFGARERADSLIAQTELVFSLFTQQLQPQERQKVYFMWAQGPYETSGTQSTVNELIEKAGAVNACPEPQEHLVAGPERLLQWKPDVIVMWHNERLDPADICAMPALQSLPAVRAQRVYELPSVFYCDLWTLKCRYAAMLVASWCYPEAMRDFDPEKERVSMLRTLFGAHAEGLPP